MQILTEEEGKELLKISRIALEKLARHEHFIRPKKYSDSLDKNHGVICRIIKDGKLRSMGYSGLPHSLLPIIDATLHSIISAAQDNPQDPITSSELDEIKVEISILSEPQAMSVKLPNEVLEAIEPEKNGVMIRYGIYESFLLPQDWKDTKSKEDFMNKLCTSAGLTNEMWKDPRSEISKFHAQVFIEE